MYTEIPEIRRLCEEVKELLLLEANIVLVNSPAIVCGDIHGQYYDLQELFHKAEPYRNHTYVFLGDYVDRGAHSVETFVELLRRKIQQPATVLLRGNHECRQLTQVYGFYDECARYYSLDVWRWCSEVFDLLPLAAIIDQHIFCVHGGLSPDLHSLAHIMALDRACEVPHEGPLADLLWSDPEEDRDPGFTLSARGAGYLFGATAADNFLRNNGLSFILRSHQLAMDGHKAHFRNKTVYTVWSAPNYCYRCGNKASFAVLTPGCLQPTFVEFSASKLSRAPDGGPKTDYFL